MADFRRLAQLADRHWPALPPLILGGLLRFVGLTPAFLYGDEAEYASVAASLGSKWDNLAYPAVEGLGPTPFVSQPPLLLYWFAWAGNFVGSDELGPLLVSASLGTLTILITYILGSWTAGRRTGTMAAFIIAVLPFHVGISRSAQLDAGFTFLFALTVCLFGWWLQRPLRGRALAVGAAAAATVFAKLPGILVYIPLAMVVAVLAFPELLALHNKAHQVRARTRLAIIGRHTGLVVAPVALLGALYFFLLVRLHAVDNLLRKLGWQAGRVSGSRTDGTPARGWLWYFSEPQVGLVAQVHVFVAVLALIGLILAIRKIMRRDGTRREVLVHTLVVAWVLTVLVFFTASYRKEWFYLMPVMPGLAILAAEPLATWSQRLPQLYPRFVPTARPHVPRPGVPATPVTWLRAEPRRWLGVAVPVTVLVFALFAPAVAAVDQRLLNGNEYGSGVKQAALWIQERDPDAVQAGTTLGRFTLHFYNHQPTYHYYMEHAFVEDQARNGKLRFVVIDRYLNLTFEQEWLEGLAHAHNGTLVKEFGNEGKAMVQVYELGSARQANATLSAG